MNKMSDKLIAELNVFFSLYPMEQRRSSAFIKAQSSLNDIIKLKSGVYLGESSFSHAEEKVILDIIQHCDEATQEELINSFGEESLVAQLIRKNRIEKHKSTKKTYYSYGLLEDSLRKEIKDIQKNGNPFYKGVCDYMKRLGYSKDSDFYNSIGMPRQQFARLRDAENNLSKKTVLWIIVGLKLNYQEASDLLMKAGYSFRKSDMRDVVLMYIFRNADYSLGTVNEVLEHFGLEPFC